MTQVKVTLGAHELDVYPQRHAYLTNKLAKYLVKFQAQAGSITGETLVDFLGDQVYDVLCICIPKMAERIPEYEFMGYGSKENFDSQFYVEEEDQSPTLPEIINAFEMVSAINRLDVVKQITKIVDPNQLRLAVQRAIQLQSSGSQNSPSAKDGPPASTTSGAKSPTSTESTDSPSSESSPSESGTPAEEDGNSES